MGNVLRAAPVAARCRGRGLPVNHLSHWSPLAGARPLAAMRQIDLISTEPIQLLDLTDQVSTFSREFGSWHGVVSIFSRHTTAAVRVQEDESLLLEDLRQFLPRLAPPEAQYGQNDFRVPRACHDEAEQLIEDACTQLDSLLPESQAKLMLRAFSWFVLARHY